MAALDFPNSPTPGQQYNAPNSVAYTWDGATWTLAGPAPSGVAGGDLTGTYPNPQVTPAAKSKWAVSGSTLTPVDPTKGATITAADNQLVFGSTTAKGRLTKPAAADYLDVSYNINNPTVGTWAQDDATKPTWLWRVGSDSIAAWRVPAGSTTWSNLLSLSNVGDLTIPGKLTAAVPNVQATGLSAQLCINSNAWAYPISFNVPAWAAGQCYRLTAWGYSVRTAGTWTVLSAIGGGASPIVFSSATGSAWRMETITNIWSTTSMGSTSKFTLTALNTQSPGANTQYTTTRGDVSPAGATTIYVGFNFDTANANNYIQLYGAVLERLA